MPLSTRRLHSPSSPSNAASTRSAQCRHLPAPITASRPFSPPPPPPPPPSPLPPPPPGVSAHVMSANRRARLGHERAAREEAERELVAAGRRAARGRPARAAARLPHLLLEELGLVEHGRREVPVDEELVEVDVLERREADRHHAAVLQRAEQQPAQVLLVHVALRLGHEERAALVPQEAARLLRRVDDERPALLDVDRVLDRLRHALQRRGHRAALLLVPRGLLDRHRSGRTHDVQGEARARLRERGAAFSRQSSRFAPRTQPAGRRAPLA